MKKSKVIIPAMALLLFSTAASITGTVAWFSSTRTFTSEAGKFAVAQLEGNLACVVTDGTATTVSGDKNQNITFDAKTYLGDASFNHTNKTLFTDVPDTTTSFKDLGAWALTKGGDSDWYYGKVGDDKYFYAATWKYTFTYSFVAEQTNMNLYFDVNNALSDWFKADGTDKGSDTIDTAQGFRLAFVSSYSASSSKQIVWAPFRAQDDATPKAIRYVSSTSAEGDYGTELLDSTAKANTTTYGLGTADAQKADTLANCLGVFTNPHSPGNVTITVEMTAWFEGTDAAVVTETGKKFQQVSATLPFAVRPAAA